MMEKISVPCPAQARPSISYCGEKRHGCRHVTSVIPLAKVYRYSVLREKEWVYSHVALLRAHKIIHTVP